MAPSETIKITAATEEEGALLAAIDATRLPRHIAVIMDGNGRWARQRNKQRVDGHRAGITSVREVVESCTRLGIPVLTLYAFSVENWKRPKTEVATLMALLRHYLRREVDNLRNDNIRFRAVGRTSELPEPVRRELARAEEQTGACTGMAFNLALNYGGRTELVDAARRLAEAVQSGALRPDQIDEQRLAACLYTAGQPDPDLLIRTSGELRISNFLLWQIAYAEIWVHEVLWPDFRRPHLLQAVVDFQRRERRYGGIGAA